MTVPCGRRMDRRLHFSKRLSKFFRALTARRTRGAPRGAERPRLGRARRGAWPGAPCRPCAADRRRSGRLCRRSGSARGKGTGGRRSSAALPPPCGRSGSSRPARRSRRGGTCGSHCRRWGQGSRGTRRSGLLPLPGLRLEGPGRGEVAVEQLVVAVKSHLAKGISPALPRLPGRSDDQGAVADAHLHLAVQPRLLEERLGDADPLGVPDLDASRAALSLLFADYVVCCFFRLSSRSYFLCFSRVERCVRVVIHDPVLEGIL